MVLPGGAVAAPASSRPVDRANANKLAAAKKPSTVQPSLKAPVQAAPPAVLAGGASSIPPLAQLGPSGDLQDRAAAAATPAPQGLAGEDQLSRSGRSEGPGYSVHELAPGLQTDN